MKPEHKEYILNNIGNLSVKRISQDLNLKEKKIWEFLECQKVKEGQSNIPPPKKEIPVQKAPVFFSVMLIMFFGFTVYGNSFNNEFLWDDVHLVEDNSYIRNWSNLEKIFTKDIMAGAARRSNFYRPIQTLTYTVDYSLWKLDVRGYHFTNTLLHVFSALAVFWLINILYGKRLLSLLTSLFFVIHPIHTETITYIAGRADSLALFFVLLTLIFYIKHLNSENRGTYIFMLLSYIFALLSKESSLILLPLLLLYHYSHKIKIKLIQLLPLIGITIFYILLRVTVFSFHTTHSPEHPATLFERIPTFFAAITSYARILFLPFDLHMGYGYKQFGFADPKVILGIMILSFLFVYGFKQRNKNALIFFSLSWFFVALIPVSNLYPINAYMAEHWLYLPSIGIFLILSDRLCALSRFKHLEVISKIIIMSLMIFYSYLTVKQNTYWKNPVTFFERALKYTPNNHKMYYNLGTAYTDLGKSEYAIIAYEKAIEINPTYDEAHINLGVAYYNAGMRKEAETTYKKAIELSPDSAEPYSNLGIIEYDRGNDQKAIDLYTKAIQVNSNYGKAYNNLAIVYVRQKKFKLAIEYCDKARKLGFPRFDILDALEPYR